MSSETSLPLLYSQVLCKERHYPVLGIAGPCYPMQTALIFSSKTYSLCHHLVPWTLDLSRRLSFCVCPSLCCSSSRVKRELSFRSRRSARLSLPSPFDSPLLPLISSSPSPPRPARILAQHCPSHFEATLALCASGSVRIAPTALVGLVLSRANAIGGTQLDSVRYSLCALRLLSFSFTAPTFFPSPFMPPLRLTRLRYQPPSPIRYGPCRYRLKCI